MKCLTEYSTQKPHSAGAAAQGGDYHPDAAFSILAILFALRGSLRVLKGLQEKRADFKVC